MRLARALTLAAAAVTALALPLVATGGVANAAPDDGRVTVVLNGQPGPVRSLYGAGLDAASLCDDYLTPKQARYAALLADVHAAKTGGWPACAVHRRGDGYYVEVVFQDA